MESYKVNRRSNGLKIPFQINNNFESNEKEFGERDNLQEIALNHVNPIQDNELLTYSFRDLNTWKFRLFFNKYIEFKNQKQVDNIKSNIYTEEWEKYISKLFDFYDFSLENNDTLEAINTTVDTVKAASNIYISNNGNFSIPTFANSFTYPFLSKKEVWENNKFKYNNFPYLYNSFLKVDYYDSIDNLTQNLLFTQVAYVNPRYNDLQTINNNVEVLSPNFNFNEATSVYQFQWLKESYLDELYVTYTFWDALNGELVFLVPITNHNNDKKWVFDPLEFNNNNLYLKYQLNNEGTFVPFEYDGFDYRIKAENIDLYELVYDNEFANANPKISPLQTIEEQETTVDNLEDGFNISLNASNINSNEEIDYLFFNATDFTTKPIEKTLENKNNNFTLEFKNIGSDKIQLRNIKVDLTSDLTNLVYQYTETDNWRSDKNFFNVITQNYPILSVQSIPSEKLKPEFIIDAGLVNVDVSNDIRFPQNTIDKLPIDRDTINNNTRDEYSFLLAEEMKVTFDRNKENIIESGEVIPINIEINLGRNYGFFTTEPPSKLNGDIERKLQYKITITMESLDRPIVKERSLNLTHTFYINTEKVTL